MRFLLPLCFDSVCLLPVFSPSTVVHLNSFDGHVSFQQQKVTSYEKLSIIMEFINFFVYQ